MPRLPTPPAELCDEAKVEWRRVAGELYRLGMLTGIDRGALAAYCQAYGRWRVAERAIIEMAKRDPITGGLLIKTTNGNVILNPMAALSRKALADVVRYAAEFGMTPSARSRISTAPRNSDNPFAEFAD